MYECMYVLNAAMITHTYISISQKRKKSTHLLSYCCFLYTSERVSAIENLRAKERDCENSLYDIMSISISVMQFIKEK